MPCGSIFEDFFSKIGVSLEKLRDEQTGGWMFNYIEAFKVVNVETVLFFVSREVRAVQRFKHKPTGAEVCILPLSSTYHRLMSLLRRPNLAALFRIRDVALYFLMPALTLRRELKRYGCDAILFQDYASGAFDTCMLVAKSLGLPVFATFQGTQDRTGRWGHFARPLSLGACGGLIIAATVERDRMKARYHLPSSKLGYIFNPLEPNDFVGMDRDEARRRCGISTTAKVAVCHGRIAIKQKGLDVLLKAWDEICVLRPMEEMVLLLVGDGKDADSLKQLLDARVMKNTVVWIHEYVRDRARLRTYISCGDVYVMASRNEGFPVAPLEAMACGLPVVAADAPGIQDIFPDGEASGGIVVPREDAKALATGLLRVLNDNLLARELARRARERAESAFSLNPIGQQLRQFLFGDAL